MQKQAVLFRARAQYHVAFVLLLLLAPWLPRTAWADSPYTVDIRMQGQGKLEDALQDGSELFRLKDRPPASETLLQRRIDDDQARFQQTLRARGYYAASVSLTREQQGNVVALIFTITPGDRYTFSSVDISVDDNTSLNSDLLHKKSGVQTGKAAESKIILDGEKALLAELQEQGFLWAEALERSVVVDHATRLVTVNYAFHAGPATRFGPLSISCPEGMDQAVVTREIPWKEGAPFRKSLLEKARSQLTRRGLFSMVQVEPDPAAKGLPVAPVKVSVADRKHRSIALGLHYRTDEGPGAEALWENRNMFDKGHRLTLQSQLSSIDQNASVQYEMPGFVRDDQTLTLHLKAASESPDAYDSRFMDTGLWLERRISPQLTIGGGPELRLSHVEERYSDDTFFMFAFPVELNLDNRDDRLNPVEGGLLKVRTAPYLDLNGMGTAFSKNEVQYSLYHDFTETKDLVLAARLRVGAIAGDNLEDVPADIRFYSGGGGSVRGYGYQMAGPLDCKEEPVGGRSVLEGAVELRKHLKGNLGLAFFIDGGTVYSAALPDLSEPMRWGAGVGIRYFTPIGPVRLDVAAPLNGRSGVDHVAQFYVSLGQAF